MENVVQDHLCCFLGRGEFGERDAVNDFGNSVNHGENSAILVTKSREMSDQGCCGTCRGVEDQQGGSGRSYSWIRLDMQPHIHLLMN